MHVNYCDLCGAPLKGENFFILYILLPGDTKYKDEKEYYSLVGKIQKEIKDICPTCKHIIDRMFELRLLGLSELANDINKIYQLPSKKNPIERDKKNGKEKKK